MTKRIIMGRRGGALGFWVSRPGVDVETASENQMMVSTNRNAFQIVASGTISNPANQTDFDFTIPDQGFTPMVMATGSWICAYSFPNSTTLRVRTVGKVTGAESNTVQWLVTNQKINH